jgi:hypothetical protein
MIEYKNGKIYAIRSYQTDKFYIGSTCRTLPVRFGEHKREKKCCSKEIIQYEDAYIELIELFPCNSKEELNKKESEHIRTNNCVNKRTGIKTDKEKLEYYKQYYQEHTEHLKELQKKNRDENKEKNKIRMKLYYEKNKERIQAYHKELYLKKHKAPTV